MLSGKLGKSGAAPSMKVTVKTADQIRAERETKKVKEAGIWDDKDFSREGGRLALAGGVKAAEVDGRPEPKYDVLYRQNVGTEDMYLGLSQKHGGSDYCEEITVKIHLPGTQMKDVTLDVLPTKLHLQAPKFKLSLALPYPVKEDSGSAKFDKKTETLHVVLEVNAKVQYIKDLDEGLPYDPKEMEKRIGQ